MLTKNSKHPLPPELAEDIKIALRKCYSCNKCVSGCPMAHEMDFPPSILIKWLAVGEIDKILTSNMLWMCSSCQSCYSRCPFEIDIPEVIDSLKEYASRNNLVKKEKDVHLLHKIFLSNVKRYGRIHEAGMIGEWKMRSRKWFQDLTLGAKMFLKGKLGIVPEKVKGQDEIKRLFGK